MHPSLKLAYERELKANSRLVIPIGGWLVSKIIEGKAEEATTKEQQADEPKAVPHGSEMCKALHEMMCGLHEYCEKELPRLENPKLQKQLVKFAENNLKGMAALEETHAAEYPDHEQPKSIGTDAMKAMAEAEEEESKAEGSDTEEEGKAEGSEEREESQESKAFDAEIAEIEAQYAALSPAEQAEFDAEIKALHEEHEREARQHHYNLVHQIRLQRAAERRQQRRRA
jgi:hypothetical protein